MARLPGWLKTDAFWGKCFLALLLLGVFLHCLTLTYSPVPWIDEVQTIEIARGGIGVKHTDWGLCVPAVTAYAGQAWAVYYLGGLINEMFFRAFGACGPRAASLIGLMLSTLLLYGLVRRRGGSALFAGALAMAFFAFPATTQSVRGARVDIWSVACLFAGLHCLYSAKADVRGRIECFAAGALAVTGCFCWAVGALLLPIYAWAFFENFPRPFRHPQSWLAMAAWAAAGAVAALLLWMIPFYGNLGRAWEMAQWISAAHAREHSLANIGAAWTGFWHSLMAFPWVLPVGFALTLALPGNRWLKLGLAGVVVACVVVTANVYVFRIVYFSAFAVLGIMLAARWRTTRPRTYKLVLAFLLVAAAASYLRSTVVRNAVECLTREGRDYGAFRQMLATEIGRDKRIYTVSFEPYYAGRDLGWKMYNQPLGGSMDDLRIAWDDIDGALFDLNDPDIPREALRAKGMTVEKILSMPDPHYPAWAEKIIAKAHRKRTMGPYLLFTRK